LNRETGDEKRVRDLPHRHRAVLALYNDVVLFWPPPHVTDLGRMPSKYVYAAKRKGHITAGSRVAGKGAPIHVVERKESDRFVLRDRDKHVSGHGCSQLAARRKTIRQLK